VNLGSLLHLKTQDAPKAVIDALQRLTSEQTESWKAAVKRIEEMLKE
jgi:hypothetical protein